ncbi:MAG TPA: PEP/pyruvate-binding domain-containing protein [Microlunatus sp.]
MINNIIVDLATNSSRVDEDQQLSSWGGKGASLVRLSGAGLPVPEGFVITTEAYRSAAQAAGIDAARPELLTDLTSDDLDGCKRASKIISELLLSRPIPADVVEQISTGYRALAEAAGDPGVAVAVRSSATAEDLPGMSFAGQQDSYLNVHGVQGVLDAVRRCWASLWNARAIAYRIGQGVDQRDVELAVVVQRLVPAEAAGVLFTADPLTGDPSAYLINAGWGLGEAVVGGQVSADSYRIDADTGTVINSEVSEKMIMTVRTPEGTTESPVPADRRQAAVCTDRDLRRLHDLGRRIADLYGRPMDIEWCRDDHQPYVVQARPITTGAPADPWNDSLQQNVLWSNGNVGEAVPDVMTPATWSMVRQFMADAMPTFEVPPYSAFGRVGGRIYLNLSLMESLAGTIGIAPRIFRAVTRDAFGRIPADLEIPRLRLPWARVVRGLVPQVYRSVKSVLANLRQLDEHLAAGPATCARMRRKIGESDLDDLGRLWHAEIEPGFHRAGAMLAASARSGGLAPITVRRRIQRKVGDQDAELLLTGAADGANPLASMGLLTGLELLAGGEIDRNEFGERFGHRGPHEFELSIPRPGEDDHWIDDQLAARKTGSSTSALLDDQNRARVRAWQRLADAHPRTAARMRPKIQQYGAVLAKREQARTEVVRYFWVLRAFWLRVGELTGIGDDVFYYEIDELLRLVQGRRMSADTIGGRRATYRRYCELPPYPSLILGLFDPARWAADPHRRSDVYRGDRPADAPGEEKLIKGFAGAAGVVEGIARVLTGAEQGSELQDGEILVTSITNVGWTPIFPRVAAVITDVGAPLSHAAIVARELGIPAVVGCGTATMRVHTGDRILVDGAAGTVQLLD